MSSENMLSPKFSLRQASNSSSSSLSGSPLSRQLTPRRSITPKQAIDDLELALTQSNDVQHILEEYASKIDEQTTNIKKNINEHIDGIINKLNQRKKTLFTQVSNAFFYTFYVDEWKSGKLQQIDNEMTNASNYEQTLIKASNECNAILCNDKMDKLSKKQKIKKIKNQILAQKMDKKYTNSSKMTAYINNMTTLIDIKYDKNIKTDSLNKYGQISSNPNNSFLSVPVLNLLKPEIIKQSKNGYKLKLQWNVSFNDNNKNKLIAQNFIIRCLSIKNTENENQNDEKSDDHSNGWKCLLFQINARNESNFEAIDIETIFVFDHLYKFRIEYHVMSPINLLVSSNEQSFEIQNKPPSADKAQFIDLEYVSNKGHSYEGHPKYLLFADESKIYRSKHNKDFDYGEHDFVIFKIMKKRYLPKAIVIRNCSGMQSLKRMKVSIGSKKDGNEWNEYDEIKVEDDGDEYQQFLLNGVDWNVVKDMKSQFIKLEFLANYGEARGAQCRFKVKEVKLYGLEF